VVTTQPRLSDDPRAVVEDAPDSQQSTGRRFAVYTSSLGNYFFDEIRDLLAAGFRELGFLVDLRNETAGFSGDAEWHVVIAPHEFFQLGAGRELLQKPTPRRLILVNTEQPSTTWFSLAAACFPRAHTIWDISHDSASQLAARGYRCGYLRLGYSAGFEAAQAVEMLPENYGTCFLPAAIRKTVPGSIEDRPLDLFFVGHLSARREGLLATLAPTLAKHRCYIHLSSPAAPVIPGKTTHMDSATVMGLAQRAKVVLNLHHGSDRYFEWHRIVIQGLWNGALVISEPSSSAPPFRAGIDYVEAPIERLGETIDYYLSTSAGMAEGVEIARHGYQTLVEQCGLGDCLRDLVDALHTVKAASVPAALPIAKADETPAPKSAVEQPVSWTDDGRIGPPLDLAGIKRRKVELIAGAGKARSIRDFGGLWGVDGLYLLEGAKALGSEYAEMIDVTPRDGFWENVRRLHEHQPHVRVELKEADFRVAELYGSLCEVDLSLLYEVLLHQDNPEEIIKRVLSRTRQCVCVAQPVLRETMFRLPASTACIQFYGEELKERLRVKGWWEPEPRVEQFDTRYWMWGQTASFLKAVFGGYGFDVAHEETYALSENQSRHRRSRPSNWSSSTTRRAMTVRISCASG
jgi:hypothetical protein